MTATTEEMNVYCIQTLSDLSPFSQRIAEDTNFSIFEIYPLCVKYGETRKKLIAGHTVQGKDEVTDLSRELAALAIVSFELSAHEYAAFPIKETLVPMVAEEALGMIVPVTEAQICFRDGADPKSLFEAGVKSTEEYKKLRDLLAQMK